MDLCNFLEVVEVLHVYSSDSKDKHKSADFILSKNNQ